jgi:uncharacterized protein YkwD
VLGAVVLAATACDSPARPTTLTISAQPQSQTVAAGSTATLSVTATGSGELRYQWYVGPSGNTAAPLDSATSASYTTPELTDTTTYWVRLTDSRATADSSAATITVSAAEAPPSGPTPASAPSITSEPVHQTISTGQTATLGVEAAGTAPLAFQWFTGQSGNTASPLGGATSKSYVTPALTSTTSYWVRVSNAVGSTNSVTATVTVTVPPPVGVAPSITTQPQSQTVNQGQAATLSVGASGTAPLAYQWYAGSSGTTSSPVSGATSSSFTTPALSGTASYWARVSNAFGASDSSTATITVNVPPPAGVAPAITLHPQSVSVTSGQTATLVMAASGTAPLSFQWYVGPSGTISSPIGGATAPSYTTPPLAATTSYWVRVSNAFGASDSITATVTVAPDGSNAAFEDQVLSLVNARRAAGATCGGTVYPPAPALPMNASLRLAARGHSQDMATQNYFSHVSLDGRTFDQRIRNAGYTGSFPLGENIAGGQPTPQAVVDGWMGSAGHCANIMNPSFRATGVGYAFNPAATYRHYWTQTFGGS